MITVNVRPGLVLADGRLLITDMMAKHLDAPRQFSGVVQISKRPLRGSLRFEVSQARAFTRVVVRRKDCREAFYGCTDAFKELLGLPLCQPFEKQRFYIKWVSSATNSREEV